MNNRILAETQYVLNVIEMLALLTANHSLLFVCRYVSISNHVSTQYVITQVYDHARLCVHVCM